jgi:hypothetical protein
MYCSLVCQVMIINFLGMFFKVQPLKWDEWLVTVAIGAGAMIWSFLVRWMSRNINWSGLCSCCHCCGAVGSRLARLNKVRSKHVTAAAAVYGAAGAVELTVQEAVSMARNKQAVQETEAQSQEKSGKSKTKKNDKGRAGTWEERTLSGRSDSAGSLGGNNARHTEV